MEIQEEVMGCKRDQSQMIKRKRTKRPRMASPLSLTMATTSSSTGEGFDAAATCSSNSGESARSSEEEDMANCLILLAQGHIQKPQLGPLFSPSPNKPSAIDAYQCKTCNRCFPSFQALGGHRASHKKPKTPSPDEKKPLGLIPTEQDAGLFNSENTTTTALSLQITNRALLSQSPSNKNRVHECSICGAEFNSGQALGGHMRRHRPIPVPAASSSHEESHKEIKKQRNMLSLDLNLPAPEDDHRESKFPFAAKEQVIVFSASPLVDCHY